MAEDGGASSAALLGTAGRSLSTRSASSSYEATSQAYSWLLPRALDPGRRVSRQLFCVLRAQHGVELEGLEPAGEELAQLRRLRAPILLSTLLWAAALAVQVVCMLDGWMVLFCAGPIPMGSCTLLWYWALGYCTAVTCLSICPAPAEVAVVCCVLLAPVARMAGHGCSEQLCGFADLVIQVGLPSVACVAAAVGLARLFLPELRQLQVCSCGEGLAPAEVIAVIEATCSAETAPEDGECVVCMAEADETTGWTSLKCGHGFHQECLKEWLARSSRCPLCRLDLKAAYFCA